MIALFHSLLREGENHAPVNSLRARPHWPAVHTSLLSHTCSNVTYLDLQQLKPKIIVYHSMPQWFSSNA